MVPVCSMSIKPDHSADRPTVDLALLQRPPQSKADAQHDVVMLRASSFERGPPSSGDVALKIGKLALDGFALGKIVGKHQFARVKAGIEMADDPILGTA